MAAPSVALVRALRSTADRLAAGSAYRWSDFGLCNCGHLAQTITRLPARTIAAAAFESPGDWGAKAREYCGVTGLPVTYILDRMMDLGLAPADVGHLERLSDPAVQARLGRQRALRHYRREDVIDYLRAWADLLEARLETPAQAEASRAAPERDRAA